MPFFFFKLVVKSILYPLRAHSAAYCIYIYICIQYIKIFVGLNRKLAFLCVGGSVESENGFHVYDLLILANMRRVLILFEKGSCLF